LARQPPNKASFRTPGGGRARWQAAKTVKQGLLRSYAKRNFWHLSRFFFSLSFFPLASPFLGIEGSENVLAFSVFRRETFLRNSDLQPKPQILY
jgi:hypothetical protein